MLAIITHGGTCLVDPASFKSSPGPFPISSSLECSTSAWSPDNSQLYLSNTSYIKRYTPSECLLEEIYSGSDIVTCMEMMANDNSLFFAAGNKVWSLDCIRSSARVISSLEPHNGTITRISISNDGTLLATMSSSTVFIHNLPYSSHIQLKGLPNGKPVTCCLFHQHSGTKLLLGVGRDLTVYDSTRPSSPLKSIRIPGSGDVVGVATSPFSKTLVAAISSNGDVALVDLDKDSGILKTVNVTNTLTCCAFTAEGAAIYLGTKDGKLLILDLRSLEKEPKSFIIGGGDAPIDEIKVRGKSKSNPIDTTSRKVKSSLAATVKLSPQRSASSTRTFSAAGGSTVGGLGVKSPTRVSAVSRIRGGGVTPKKHFSPARSPLLEAKNFGPDARVATSRLSAQSRRAKPLRLQRGKEHEENHEVLTSLPSPTFPELTEPAGARQRGKPSSSHKVAQDVERLGLGSAPESISGHLAAMRVRSSSTLDDGSKREANRPTRRVISESIENGRKPRSTSSISAQSRVAPPRVTNKVGYLQEKQRRSATPDDTDDHLDLSSLELPHEPVTPISLGKNLAKAPSVITTSTGIGTLGIMSPDIARCTNGGNLKGKGKEKVAEVKKARFAQQLDAEGSSGGSDDSAGDTGTEILDEQRNDGRDQELSLQVSPCRPAAPTWLRSPHRSSGANLNMNAAAQDFLRNVVHDVMYDFQRETKAELMGLHLDLVRMGRGLKHELRGTLEEEIRALRAENKRLKEENEKLRRGY